MKNENLESLTGLPNRPALTERLKNAVSSADGVALALLDLDQFGAVNARFGHEAGDEVLRQVAGVLSEHLPGGVYRTSGDEFALVMPGLTLEQAFLRMEALRGQLQETLKSIGGIPGHTMTVTIGVAQAPRDARTHEALLTMSMSAMVAAKEAGRNQVGLPPNEEMVMKSCYYASSSVRRLKALAEKLNRKESQLLREALEDLLRKHDKA